MLFRSERAEDVPALARFFLQKSAKELGVEPKRITEEALEKLKSFEFPGNVRQLENVCHWLTVMAPAQVIEVKDLPPELLGGVVAESVHSLSVLASAPAGSWCLTRAVLDSNGRRAMQGCSGASGRGGREGSQRGAGSA